jgi:predicted small secreted protein
MTKRKYGLLWFNLLLALLLIGCTIFALSGCSNTVSIGDDVERFRSISILIKQYNDALMVHGAANDTLKMQNDYKFIMNLEQNRLDLVKRVFEENGNAVAGEIISDNYGVRWNDMVSLQQGDVVAHNEYGIGMVVSKDTVMIKNQASIDVAFGIKVFITSPYALVKVNNNLLPVITRNFAEKIIKQINSGGKKYDER